VANRQRSGAAAAGAGVTPRRAAGGRPAIPDEVIRVLSVLPSASMVVDPDGLVLRSSARATALGLVNRTAVTIPDIVHLIERVAVDGHAREQEMRVRRPPLGRELLELRVRVAALGTGAILVLIDDLAEERRVEEVRRDFVANVSHELKTPVGGISLLAEAILEARDDPDAVERFAQRIGVESTRLTTLVQEIVELSRLQADDALAAPVLVDIGRVVREAIELTRVLAEGHDITFVASLDPHTCAYGDAAMLRTAVGNLLTNAVNYSPPGTRVAITARTKGFVVEIAVADQGHGIPAATQERIFERFYRVDQARSRVTGGTGLGLAIVKHVCQNHGGECTVWSEPGVGSTFTLRLPSYQSSTPFDRDSHELSVEVLAIPTGEVPS
jgi:two-component system sensor histidine kinase SenX3